MHILWLTTVFDDSAVSRVLLQLIPYFPREYRITVVSVGATPQAFSQALSQLTQAHITHISLKCKKHQFIRMKKTLDALIAELKPNVVHAQLGIAYVALLLAKPHMYYKKLASFHNNANYFNRYTSMMVKLLFKRFDAISAVSRTALESIEKSFDPHSSIPSRVIYNPVAIPKNFPTTEVANDLQVHGYRLLVVGRLVPQKGHELWINMLPLLHTRLSTHHNQVTLFCVGDGPLANHIIAQCEKQDIVSHVKMLGYRNDVSSLLAHADAVLFPSQNEGFGLVPCEAILSDTPVVVHPLPVMEELLQDKNFMVDCRNPVLFAEKVYHVLTEKAYYRTHVDALKPLLTTALNPATIAESYARFYTDAFNNES